MQSPLKEGLKCKTLSFSELFIPYKKKGIILQEFSKITMIINIAWRKLINMITLDYSTESPESTARTKSESAASRIKSY